MSNTSAIGNSGILPSLLSQSDRVSTGKKDGAQQAVVTATSDSAAISSTASSLSQVSTTDDVRTDKVAAIQSAIATGTYFVSAGDVADKLMQHLLG